jgi:hypothetical protein
MNVVTTLDYSILAGAAYYSTRAAINRFPIHQDWSELIDDRTLNEQSGFEALAFQSGNQIVLSYSGTNPEASWTSGDWQTNFALLNGNWADRLLQTAEYYLQIKAANPGQSVTFTLTGHSLGRCIFERSCQDL